MSWFDATGFANLAKSALKEAQKTIDKALDIKEDELRPVYQKKVSPEEDAESFFAAWGLKSGAGNKFGKGENPEEQPGTHVPPTPASTPTDPKLSGKATSLSTSLWGSFTGSFFENPKTRLDDDGQPCEAECSSDDPVSSQPKKCDNSSMFLTSSSTTSGAKSSLQEHLDSDQGWNWGGINLESTMDGDTEALLRLKEGHEEDSLFDDSSEMDGFSRSKLVVGSIDSERESVPDIGSDCRLHSVSESQDEPKIESEELDAYDKDESERTLLLQVAESGNSMHVETSHNVPSTRSQSYPGARLSIHSTGSPEEGSEKKSSESVEVLGSSASTSPESEMLRSSSEVAAIKKASLQISMLSRDTSREVVSHSSPESVEVIPESLTSPSSVEVLGSSRASSSYTSPTDPEHTLVARVASTLNAELQCALSKYHEGQSTSIFSSAPETPASEDASKSLDLPSFDSACDSIEKVSPESVEVIPEEETSYAESMHSSTSASSTTTTTIMEPKSEIEVVKPPSESELKPASHSRCLESESSLSDSKTMLDSGGTEVMDSSSDTVMPSDREIESSSADTHSEPVEPGAETSGLVSVNVSEISEHTNVETSENNLVKQVCSTESQNSSESGVLNTSSYVRTMLADAMIEKEEEKDAAREQSPISSESRSDMVKVESEQTSGQTSGDELETTTSSDIEIISSPNGDSSSTHSRHSPAKLVLRTGRGNLASSVDRSDSPGSDVFGLLTSKEKAGGLKTKGHQRELSEASSGGSDDIQSLSEVDKLLKKIQEMNEILESRETKLIELSRMNVDLQEFNDDLKSQLEVALQTQAAELQDVNKITEEYTQRLSSLERKFQQAIRDKELLQKQLEQAKQESATRLSQAELEALVSEKDEIIKELRDEGEKLSKQQLQHSNIIKKLRAKEKENENTIKNQKEQLEELNQEMERLKKSLAAKDEVERTQIEAVHQLTARAKRQEKEIASLRSQLEDSTDKVDELKASLEKVHVDLAESQKENMVKDREVKEKALSAEVAAKQELQSALEYLKQSAAEEREQLLQQIDNLRMTLRKAEEEHTSREESLRQEVTDLIRRLERAEARNEELSQSASVATRPLLRQIESLQTASSNQQATWEKVERNLTEKLGEAQSKISSLVEQERSSREQCITMGSRVTLLESHLNTTQNEIASLRAKLEAERVQCQELQRAKDKESSLVESLRKSLAEEVGELRREVVSLEEQLSVERTATEAERRKNLVLQEQLREREQDRGRERRESAPATPRSSPTLSFGRASLSESISSATWPQFQDDGFDTVSTMGRYNVYDSLRAGNTTSLLEGLQSQLKLRDGEVQQLQWEMSRREQERAALAAEVSQLTARAEEMEEKLLRTEQLRTAFQDVEHKYNALLQMYGEKMEENEELRLDLQDVKEMYKAQIDQLLKKEPGH